MILKSYKKPLNEGLLGRASVVVVYLSLIPDFNMHSGLKRENRAHCVIKRGHEIHDIGIKFPFCLRNFFSSSFLVVMP